MIPFGMPEVLLLVVAQNGAAVGDEVGDVDQFTVVCRLHNRTRDEADIELFGQRTICVTIFSVRGTYFKEFGILRNPVGEMVFWQNGQVTAWAAALRINSIALLWLSSAASGYVKVLITNITIRKRVYKKFV